MSDPDSVAKSNPDAELSPERRAALARKGEKLYAKQCTAKGPSSCAEGFAAYQLELGHTQVVRDFLEYLLGQVATLGGAEQGDLQARTEALIDRIRRRLEGRC
jgi:hypothetical protein